MSKLINIIIVVLIISIIIIVSMLFLLNSNKNISEEERISKNENIQNMINNAYLSTDVESNKFEFMNVSDQTMSIKYLLDYKEQALYNTDKAYNLLDEEYKQAKFGSIERYSKYLQNTKEELQQAYLTQYQVKKYDDYTQYVLIDQFSNYYIIREKTVMDYTVILDTFTIDLPEYIEKYNSSNEQQKVAMCIDKFIKNVNAENYTLAYNMLAQSFKNSYFQTQASFEEYVKQNLLGKENITFGTFANEGDVYYTYSVTLDNENQSTYSVQKNFIVNLKTGTDFELSFNI